MVKVSQKPLITKKNPINHASDTLLEYPVLKKSRKQIHREYYQRHKERRNNQEKERYAQKKQQAQQQERENLSKYYKASAIKILLSLKDYTELNQQKQKLWADFN
jgi:GrpB-like predicted nucleotidyltransferase (UPF0157 family)